MNEADPTRAFISPKNSQVPASDPDSRTSGNWATNARIHALLSEPHPIFPFADSNPGAHVAPRSRSIESIAVQFLGADETK
jgi:hypothetical protein